MITALLNSQLCDTHESELSVLIIISISKIPAITEPSSPSISSCLHSLSKVWMTLILSHFTNFYKLCPRMITHLSTLISDQCIISVIWIVSRTITLLNLTIISIKITFRNELGLAKNSLSFNLHITWLRCMVLLTAVFHAHLRRSSLQSESMGWMLRDLGTRSRMHSNHVFATAWPVPQVPFRQFLLKKIWDIIV